MAHFAQIDDSNMVVYVTRVDNEYMVDENGIEQEHLGVAHLDATIPGLRWKQTSYNANFRGCYAGIGYRYDPGADVFVPPPEDVIPQEP